MQGTVPLRKYKVFFPVFVWKRILFAYAFKGKNVYRNVSNLFVENKQRIFKQPLSSRGCFVIASVSRTVSANK